MSEDILARKGEAFPSAFGTDESDAFALAFAARRVVSLLPAVWRLGAEHGTEDGAEDGNGPAPEAAPADPQLPESTAQRSALSDPAVQAEPAPELAGPDPAQPELPIDGPPIDGPPADVEAGSKPDPESAPAPELHDEEDDDEDEDELWLPVTPNAGVNGTHAPSSFVPGQVPALKPALPLPSTYEHRRSLRGRVKFTFRIDNARHAAFKAAADELGISRQKFLLRALDTHLCALGYGSFLPSSEARDDATFD